MKTLLDLYYEHEGKLSDKWLTYIKRYDRLFAPYRDKPVRLLEIGVQNGGSLEIWGKYFHNAEAVVGVDVDERCGALRYENPAIKVWVRDIKEIAFDAPYDIIIDDGSHMSSDIIATLRTHWYNLFYGGIYIIEDLHCSYWPSHNREGELRSIEYLKNIIDAVNQDPDKGYHSIEFSNSLCVIKKDLPENNTLGARLIAGKDKII